MGTTTPDFPEPEGMRELRRIAERFVAQQNAQMVPIRKALNEGALAEIQRASARLRAELAPTQAAMDSIITPELQATLRDIRSRHEALFAQVRSSIAPEVVSGILEAEVPRVTSHLSGEVHARSHVSGEITVNPAPTGGGKVRYTPEQIAAAAGLVLSVHSTIMGLRRGDLVDSGSLALLIAVVLLLVALSTDPDE